MPIRFRALTAAAALAALACLPAAAETRLDTSAGPVIVERMIDGLTEPWALAFLPGGAMLVTERAGRLLHIAPDGARRTIEGLPQVAAQGQGGLLDIAVPRDFAETGEVLFTYAIAQNGGAGTALGVGVLDTDAGQLQDVRVLFQSAPGWRGGRHFGSRVAEGPDGHLFVSIGDRGDDSSAQDRGNHNGAIVRIARDGSVPDDNPFVGEPGVQSELWTWGNRNPQGLAFAPDGRLWSNEHGPRGGDEVNLIEAGNNYGWPVIGEGVHYSGRPMPRGVDAEGMVRPVADWSPAFAPSGLAVYSGRLWSAWEGSLLNGSLQQDRIARIDPDDGFAEESLKTPEMARVRDVREAPDGTIWFLSVAQGAAFRIRPAD